MTRVALDLSAAAITARLEAASALADLRPEHRLDAKIDLRAEAITNRLRIASELRDVCIALAVGRTAGTPNVAK